MSHEQNKDISQYFYRASAADFMKIPGSPVAYWTKEKERDRYQSGEILNDVSFPRKGLDTGENEVFLRLWHEVPKRKSCFEGGLNGFKWYPYNKGGDFRRWYGNREFLINWENDGKEIKTRVTWKTKKPTIRNAKFYFREGMTWTTVSSGGFSARYAPKGCLFDNGGCTLFSEKRLHTLGAFLNSKVASRYLEFLSPTLNFQPGDIGKILFPKKALFTETNFENLLKLSKDDWDSYESSWDFSTLPLLHRNYGCKISDSYVQLRAQWQVNTQEMLRLEEENNRFFIEAYGLEDELAPGVSLKEITLTCNPHYRYGGNRSEEELETLLQCDTLRELVSYAIGCMMGRYSLDKPGLILASQGETLQDYLQQIPNPSFAPDDDAILPLTDQEWFADDATNRFREFIRVVWGEEHLQENLDFVAESLCLHAIRPKRGESALDTIRRYLSTQFFKDHLRTYKKRPIYWLFSSGKHKAFECLVYLHRYNEGTLARMRTEYVIPLSAKLNSYAEKLEQAKESASSTAETKRLEKELTTLHNQQAELAEFDEKLRHYADQRISLDLDDGVKVNYGKFGDLLSEVRSITGA